MDKLLIGLLIGIIGVYAFDNISRLSKTIDALLELHCYDEDDSYGEGGDDGDDDDDGVPDTPKELLERDYIR